MRYLKSVTAIVFVIITVITVSYYYCLQQQYAQELIRFHVIANSNSAADQALKLRVRDAVIKTMTPRFVGIKNRAEAVAITGANIEHIEAVAQGEVYHQGKDYPVTVTFAHYPFPQKTYQNMTLPSGNYLAVRVVIGEGRGQNWWCVLFPPLCFVDGVKTYQEGEEPKGVKVFAHKDVEFRLRVLEIFKSNNF